MKSDEIQGTIQAGDAFLGLIQQTLGEAKRSGQNQFQIHAGVVKFAKAHDSRTVLSLTRAGENQNTVHQNGIRSAMSDRHGRTDYIAGMRLGVQLLPNEQPDQRNFFIFLTDGKPNEHSFQDVQNYFQSVQKQKGISLNFVAVGDDVKNSHEMQNLANHASPLSYDANHTGTYIYANQGSQISQSFSQVFRKIFACN